MTPRVVAELYTRELTRLICRADCRAIAMLQAYCDESYSGQKDTPVYVIAGFVSSVEHWEFFESLWRESMRDLQISKLGGCHAAKCEKGKGPYRHLSPEQRKEVQHRLITDIIASRLYSIVSIVDMNAYRAHKDELLALFPSHDRQYFAPHVMATRQCVQHMVRATEKATSERIAFVVDQNNEFGGRARHAYQQLVKDHRCPFRDRLGTYAEDDRTRAVGLQAADMLAYSVYRHVSGTPNWQWEALRNAVPGQVRTTGEEFWSKVVRGVTALHEAKFGAGSDQP